MIHPLEVWEAIKLLRSRDLNLLSEQISVVLVGNMGTERWRMALHGQ